MLKKLEELFDELFSSRQPIPAGMLQYQAPPDSDLPYKLHLRVEEDGSGLMLVDATVAVRLNSTAMEIARAILEEKSLDETRR